MAFLLSILLLSASAFAGNFELKQSRFEVTYSRRAQKQLIKIKGALIIGKGETERSILNALRDRVESNLDTHIILDVFGGDIAVVNKIYDELKLKCHDRGYKACTITTEVEMFRHCASACIPLFMVGDKRIAAERTNWGFHQAALVEGVILIPFMSEYVLRQKGVNSKWLKNNKAMFNTLKITWLEPLQLNGSGIITHIIGHPK